MNRRDFSAQLAFAGIGTAAGQAAWAQGTPVEGKHYLKLSTPLPVSVPAGQFEIIEFFSYGCPHCFALEPAVEAWAKQLPKDVVFVRVPVAFNATYETYQKIFYSLEAMGQLDAMHRKVFNAIHVQHQRLDKEAEIVAFMTANGIDGKKFAENFSSFSVQAKARKAQQLSQAYKIEGVPTLGVQGRFVVTGATAGSNERALAVAQALVDKLRQGG